MEYKTREQEQAEKEALNKALVNCAFKVGDSVEEPIWNKYYKWKIKELFICRGKLRALLVAVIGQYDVWDWQNKKIISRYEIGKDKLAYCSEWVENLKSI